MSIKAPEGALLLLYFVHCICTVLLYLCALLMIRHLMTFLEGGVLVEYKCMALDNGCHAV